MKKIPYIGSNGKLIEELEVKVKDKKISKRAVYEALKNHLAVERSGTAFKKNRALVKGTGRKPWRQKGTGRARFSSLKVPQMRGGGAAFGNQRRNFKYKIPDKVKRLAIKSVILSKLEEGLVKVIDRPDLKVIKTKELVKRLGKIIPQERSLLIMGDDEKKLKYSARNIPWLDYLNVNRLAIDKLFYSKNILILKDSFEEFEKILNR